MNKRTTVRIFENRSWRDSFDVFVEQCGDDIADRGPYRVLKAVDFANPVSVEVGLYSTDVTRSFSMKRSDVQRLMDDMYSAGFRPSDMKCNDESVKAMKCHLNDMRAIVSQKLHCELP